MNVIYHLIFQISSLVGFIQPVEDEQMEYREMMKPALNIRSDGYMIPSLSANCVSKNETIFKYCIEDGGPGSCCSGENQEEEDDDDDDEENENKCETKPAAKPSDEGPSSDNCRVLDTSIKDRIRDCPHMKTLCPIPFDPPQTRFVDFDCPPEWNVRPSKEVEKEKVDCMLVPEQPQTKDQDREEDFCCSEGLKWIPEPINNNLEKPKPVDCKPEEPEPITNVDSFLPKLNEICPPIPKLSIPKSHPTIQVAELSLIEIEQIKSCAEGQFIPIPFEDPRTPFNDFVCDPCARLNLTCEEWSKCTGKDECPSPPIMYDVGEDLIFYDDEQQEPVQNVCEQVIYTEDNTDNLPFCESEVGNDDDLPFCGDYEEEINLPFCDEVIPTSYCDEVNNDLPFCEDGIPSSPPSLNVGGQTEPPECCICCDVCGVRLDQNEEFNNNNNCSDDLCKCYTTPFVIEENGQRGYEGDLCAKKNAVHTWKVCENHCETSCETKGTPVAKNCTDTINGKKQAPTT